MKRLLLSALAMVTALGPIAAAPAWAGNGAAGVETRGRGDGYHGNRGDRNNWRSEGRRDQNRGGDRNWNRDNDDNRGSWNRNDGGRRDWNRGNDRRWVDNRRDDRRWDRHDYRRDRHWDRGHNYYSDNRGWSRGRHNGYYYRNTWYYGPPPSRYYGDAYYNPGYRHWSRGYRCPDYYRDNVVYYGDYGLRRPPRGYRWVRADDDFLMIAAATGIIAAVILSD